jgi:hypothetical protein
VIGKLVVAGLRAAKIFDVGVGIDVVGAETVAVVTLGLSLTTEEANGSRNARAFLPPVSNTDDYSPPAVHERLLKKLRRFWEE